MTVFETLTVAQTWGLAALVIGGVLASGLFRSERARRRRAKDTPATEPGQHGLAARVLPPHSYKVMPLLSPDEATLLGAVERSVAGSPYRVIVKARMDAVLTPASHDAPPLGAEVLAFGVLNAAGLLRLAIMPQGTASAAGTSALRSAGVDILDPKPDTDVEALVQEITAKLA